VEDWLLEVERVMRLCIKKIIEDSLKDYKEGGGGRRGVMKQEGRGRVGNVEGGGCVGWGGGDGIKNGLCGCEYTVATMRIWAIILRWSSHS
jgi:hypothetical protein